MFEIEKKHISEDIWKKHRRSYWLGTRGIGLALSILLFHFVLFPIGVEVVSVGSPTDFQDHLTATSIFASAVLTFALLAIYRDMGETQSKQADILSDQSDLLENQKKLVEIERRPWVEPSGFEPKQRFGEGGDISEPGYVWVSNYGRGPALEIQLLTKVEFDSTDSIEPSICANQLRRVTDQEFTRIDRSVPPETESVKFKLKAQLSLFQDGEHRPLPVAHATREMQKEDIDHFCYQFYILYVNSMGEYGLKPLISPRYVNLDYPSMSVYDLERNSIRLSELSSDVDVEFEELSEEDVVASDSPVQMEPPIVSEAD